MTSTPALNRTKPGARQGNENPSPFERWLKTIPIVLTVLAAGANVVAGKLLPQSVIPQPLDVLRNLGVLIAMAALLLTWLFRDGLRKHIKYVFGTTALLMVLLIALYTARVTPVYYTTTEGTQVREDTVLFITGWKVTDPALEGLTPEDLIRRAGDGWSELHAVWGVTFNAAAYTYIVLYILVMIGIVLTVSGIDFEKPQPDAGPAPAPRRESNKEKRRRQRA
jgi:hypothetical protein